MIRLKKEAPWSEVTLKNGKINKTDWVEENLDISPIKKWVEYKQKEFENIKQENSIVDPELKSKKIEKEIIKEKLDYSIMTKKELVEICKEKNIDCVGKKKEEILELLTN
jgi:hypothetical protein